MTFEIDIKGICKNCDQIIFFRGKKECEDVTCDAISRTVPLFKCRCCEEQIYFTYGTRVLDPFITKNADPDLYMNYSFSGIDIKPNVKVVAASKGVEKKERGAFFKNIQLSIKRNGWRKKIARMQNTDLK